MPRSPGTPVVPFQNPTLSTICLGLGNLEQAFVVFHPLRYEGGIRMQGNRMKDHLVTISLRGLPLQG